MDYKSSGVDIDAGNEFVKKIKPLVRRTDNGNAISGIGGFAGFYALSGCVEGMKEPVLCSATDGVGTKLKIAFAMKSFSGVGRDLVAMCVNDIVVTGGKPLFFLDYVATSKLNVDDMTEVVKGISDGCLQAGAALLGGETAEMPGMYSEDEFDLAGFAVGIVDKPKVITGENINSGDIVFGLPSSGFHSNGFSLLRKIIEKKGYSYDSLVNGKILGEIFLEPTKIYVKDVMNILNSGTGVKGLAHITGGGFYENIPRILPQGLGVNIYKENYEMPECFHFIRDIYDGDEKELYRVLNMGIGMVIVVDKDDVSGFNSFLKTNSINCYEIGNVVSGSGVHISGVDF